MGLQTTPLEVLTTLLRMNRDQHSAAKARTADAARVYHTHANAGLGVAETIQARLRWLRASLDETALLQRVYELEEAIAAPTNDPEV